MKKNKSVLGLIFISLVSLVPLVALAQTNVGSVTSGIITFGTIINTFTQSIVRSLSTLFATAAMAAFFYGIVQYIWGVRDGKPEKVKEGNKFMVSGLVALFVMFSVWGIIIYTQKIFGIDNQNTILIPDIKIQGGNTTNSPNSPLGTSPNSTGGNTGGSPTRIGGTTGGGSASVGADCTTNSECGSGKTCQNFTCQQSTTSTGGGSASVGADCTTNSECGSGKTCQNYTCQQQSTASTGNGTSGGDCTSDSECGSGMTCQNYTCQQQSTTSTGGGTSGGDCTSDSECGSGMTCQNYTCQ